VCPALNQVVKNQKTSKVFAFKGENETRIKSTSGGAFAEIAKAIVKNGGVFYGASKQKDFSVEHIRGESLEYIIKIQGTKYLQSDIFRCYDLLEKDLKDGKTVLFSGTPCQVDAINRFVALKKLPSNQLYTVDIICHGVPSSTIYKDYLKWLEKQNKSKVVEYSFRDKRISWRGSSCYAKLENGKILLNDKKLCAFMTLYYSNYITRNCCYQCKYTSQERVSDITISDYWGIEKVDKNFEDNLGVSMILINTEKGEKLFRQAQGESIIANVEKAIQPQLSKPTSCPLDRDEFWETYKAKGLEPLLKKHGGVKADSL
jgi:coenzyme F420-reducing hydrogenase beta subunit